MAVIKKNHFLNKGMKKVDVYPSAKMTATANSIRNASFLNSLIRFTLGALSLQEEFALLTPDPVNLHHVSGAPHADLCA